ncbi:uncharacterized protein ACNLHF_008739 [Anomaloglossus baeobatrachus]
MRSEPENAVIAAMLVAGGALALAEDHDMRCRTRKRRIWARKWLLERQRYTHMHLVRDLQEHNPHDFRNYLRMSESSFSYLLEKVRPYIQRNNTVMRQAVPVDERLGVTLRFLATGRSLTDLQYSSAVSRSLLSSLIPETCLAIAHALHDYMHLPNSPTDWDKIANTFNLLWQFPNCGGAIDGKHIRIMQPHNSGSYYYNYKGYHSIILMAVVNATYDFLYIDIGMNGRVSDGGVFEHTEFALRLKQNQLQLPTNQNTIGNLNFVFLADEAFPLLRNLLRPYPLTGLNVERRIFNYRLCRARRVVENAFGILSSRFRIFSMPINLKLESIDNVVLACCYLHNFLRKRDGLEYVPPGFVDVENPSNGVVELGAWRQQGNPLDNLLPQPPLSRSMMDAMENRANYCNFFNGPGAVSWQHVYN